MSRSRTNIEIDDDTIRQVMSRYGVVTKTEAVDLALRHLAGQPMSRSEALAMRGAHAILTVPVDRGPRLAEAHRKRSETAENADADIERIAGT